MVLVTSCESLCCVGDLSGNGVGGGLRSLHFFLAFSVELAWSSCVHLNHKKPGGARSPAGREGDRALALRGLPAGLARDDEGGTF